MIQFIRRIFLSSNEKGFFAVQLGLSEEKTEYSRCSLRYKNAVL